MAELDRPIWVHPARNSSWPDYPTEDKSKFEVWWTFGWPYDTSVFMARLVFSGMLQRYPDLHVITHHAGGMVPFFSGRVGPGMDSFGARTPDEEAELVESGLEGRPLDAFKLFYADTAVFGAPHALRCAYEFFGVDHMLFASDMPFDPVQGSSSGTRSPTWRRCAAPARSGSRSTRGTRGSSCCARSGSAWCPTER